MASAGPAPLRVALIGYGLAGSVFHAPLIRATPGMRLTTIVTRDPERRAQAMADNPGVQLLEDTERLWSTARQHDLVVVAAPTGAHSVLGRAALEAGLGVVMDKPLAATAADAAALAHLAGSRGSFLTVFHNRRWDGDLLTLRALIEAGDLGDVFRFESRFERFRPSPRAGSWRDEVPPEDGGGILLDLGSHVVDQALVLFGRARAVYAEVARRRPGTAVDDDVFVALTHENGVSSHLWASAVAARPGPRLRALGLAGGYSKDGLDVQEEALRGGADPGRPGWSAEPRERWGTLTTEAGTKTVETSPGRWTAFYEAVAASIRDGSPPPVSPESAVEVLRVLDAARQSAASGTVVALG